MIIAAPFSMNHYVASGGGVASYSDDFNRANGGLGSNWSQIGEDTNLSISSNTVINGAYEFGLAVYVGGDMSDDNYYSQVTCNSGGPCGPAVRATNASNFYYVRYEGQWADFRIRKVVGGTDTVIAEIYGSGSSSSVVRLEVNGTTLTAYVGGTQRLQVTDTSLSSGRPGFFISRYSGAAYIDDWSAEDV
jgi:hypothetical protein